MRRLLVLTMLVVPLFLVSATPVTACHWGWGWGCYSYCYTPCYSYCYRPCYSYCHYPCYSYCYRSCCRHHHHGHHGKPKAPKKAAPPKKTGFVPAKAKFIVSLPADAKLIVDGHATSSTSDKRVFVSPPLQPGAEYQYTFKAVVERDGQTKEVTKLVKFRAGDEVAISLQVPVATTASK